MEVLLVGAILAGLLLLRRNLSQEPEPKAPPVDPGRVGENQSKSLPLAAILWAHKTGAGFVAVGYCENVTIGSKEKTIRLPEPTMIHPGFIVPGAEPQSPGYFVGPTLDFSPSQLQAVENGAGVYQILAPLNFSGLLATEMIGLMLFANEASWRKIRAKYLAKRLSLAVGRTWPFKRSKLYRIRVPFGVLSAYTFPILLEV